MPREAKHKAGNQTCADLTVAKPAATYISVPVAATKTKSIEKRH